MYYRPREKKRHPALTLALLVMLTAMVGVLLALLGIYAGFLQVDIPDLAQEFAPTPTATRPAVLYVADGDAYFAAGKLPEAVAAYEQAIKLDPTDDVPYIRQSRLLVYTGNTAKAAERAAQAVLLNPNSAENMAYYCRALDWEAEYGAAFDACSCGIELDPNYAESYAFLSEVYADRGEWYSARTNAQQAIDTNFQSMDAHHNMGYALEIQGQYSAAVEFYENAIKLAPKLAPLYVAAGRSYYWLGDFKTAEERFKQAIRLNPGSPEAFDRLGWTYHTNGDYSRAVDALEQGLGVDPTFGKAWGHLGLVYYTRQNFEEATKILPKAIELSEGQFLRRAREFEIHAQIETLTGPETIPVLRGRFAVPDKVDETAYVAELQHISYQQPNLEPTLGGDDDDEFSCVTTIVESIENSRTLPVSANALKVTEAFTNTTGTATLDLSSRTLRLNLQNVPPPTSSPYELKMKFWPDREDSIGYVQPDGNGNVQVNIQFEEKLEAPIEYYYTLGLAYAYLDAPQCDKAVPWLLKSLEKDSSGGNPAWYGLRICPSASSPPTPVPTWTPVPTSTP